MEKKNLIFFLPEFVRGGAGKSILSLCSNLDNKKFNIYILCLGKCEYKKEFKKIAKIYEIKKKKTIFAQKDINKIINQISLNGLKIVFISNLFHTNVLTGIFQSKKNNTKFIFTERTTLSELFTYFGFFDFVKKMVIKILMKFSYKKSDIILANSIKVARDIAEYTNFKTTHIYPGSFNKFHKRVFKKNKIKDIVWIGRLAKEKGLEILLKSVNELEKDKFRLKILGDGPLRKKMELKVKNLNLEKNIKFLGFQKDTSYFLKRCDLLINTSYFEGFPNVVIEALSYSVPVICSKSHGGIYEILKNGNYGDLFDLEIDGSLTKKINLFFKNPKKLIKKANDSKKHLINFEKKKSAKKYEKIFEKL